jgi:hypothetical protein
MAGSAASGAGAGSAGVSGMTGGTDAGMMDDAGMNMADAGGGTIMCTTDTDNGTHSHPLTIPGSDVERGFQDAPYVLEDGGTGHTHTVELSAYEFVYLNAGTEVTAESSRDAGHTHPCVINCTMA